MALQSLIFTAGKKGADGKPQKPQVFLNALKRFALSGLLVPSQELLVAQIPAAQSLTMPGRSLQIPIQGPRDASMEVYSFTGKQGVINQGIGLITTTGGNTNVTGTGTKFKTQLQIGSTIATANGTGTILTIPSDTLATTSIAVGAGSLLSYFYSTPVIGDQFVFVDILDIAWRRKLGNRDIPAMHVFGSNTKPLFIKESLLLETDQSLLLQFLNYNTSSAASFAPIMEGRKWQYEALKSKAVFDFIDGLRTRKTYIQPYWLTLNNGWSTLASGSGSSATELLTCTGDITLVLFNVYAQAFAADNTDKSDRVTVEFQDAKDSRAIQTQPVPLSCFGGTGQNPMRLSAPWIVEPQTFLKATFKNYSASAVKVFLTFHGVAIYTGSSWRGSTLTNENLMREGAKMYAAMSVPQIRPATQQ